MFLDTVVEGILIAVAVPVNLYPILYAFRPWRSTPQGRALMVKALGNLILIDMILTYQIFGDYPGRQVVRVVGFLVFAYGMFYLLATLLTAPGAHRYPPYSWRRRSGTPPRPAPPRPLTGDPQADRDLCP